jgi:hypothetical protein
VRSLALCSGWALFLATHGLELKYACAAAQAYLTAVTAKDEAAVLIYACAADGRSSHDVLT